MMRIIPLLLTISTPAFSCSFLDELQGECVPLTTMDRCMALSDMRTDAVCNAFGHYAENKWVVYQGGKLVLRQARTAKDT